MHAIPGTAFVRSVTAGSTAMKSGNPPVRQRPITHPSPSALPMRLTCSKRRSKQAEEKNPHIKFKKNGGVTLSTPKQEESDAVPLQQFFPGRRFVPLVEVLATVNRFTHYVDELQHPQQRYHHGKPSEATIYAGIIGIGCAIGLRRMMRISHGINEEELEHAVNRHFTLDGLQAGNDRVVRLMDRLELPNLGRRSPAYLQRRSEIEVRVDSLNANYSFKYFGKEQGVAAYTFRDERDLLWYSTVFSAAERESASVIDGLMHNEVVKSDIHSTDAFGFSELVFAVSHLLGFSYAPRFKKLQCQRLYIFRNRKGVDRSTWKIKPAGYADDEIVIQQWDEILRMIATIKLKEVTASDLFRRLNSYAERVLRAGARGYIMKQESGPTMMQAIRQVLAGRIYLSDREWEVFQLIGRGKSTVQIADELHLSTKTVEAHRARVKEKLDLRTMTELISFAARWVETQDAR